jgi:hypothetical protein
MKSLRASAMVLGGLLSLAMTIAPANADTFDFTLSGGDLPFTGSGTITATNNGNGSETVTAINGTLDGSITITGVLSLSPAVNISGGGNVDNLIFPDNTAAKGTVNEGGLAFTLSDGQTLDVFFTSGELAEQSVTITTGTKTDLEFGDGGTFALTQTPLPSTWVMMIAGLFGLGFLAMRSTTKQSTGFAAA